MPIPHELVERARELAAQLGQVQPMRRGSVGERYIKCNKPGCRCATEETARHGPYYSLTRTVGKATRSRLLSPQQAQLVQQQIEAGRRFRRDLEAFWEVCEQWADVLLEPVDVDSPQVGEKGGSKPASPQRSPRRSKPS